MSESSIVNRQPTQWLPSGNAATHHDFSALYDACCTGNISVVRACLAAGADPNGTYRGQTPLMFASEFGHVDVATVLLKNGASVHAQDGYGRTALHLAAKNCNVASASLLMHAGARTDHACTLGGETEEDIVRLRSNIELTRAVLYHKGSSTGALVGSSASQPVSPDRGQIQRGAKPQNTQRAVTPPRLEDLPLKASASTQRLAAGATAPANDGTSVENKKTAVANTAAVAPRQTPAAQVDSQGRNHTPPRRPI